MKTLATLILTAFLTACGGGDHTPSGVVSPVADTATAAAPLSAAEPAPAPVATPTSTSIAVPVDATRNPEPSTTYPKPPAPERIPQVTGIVVCFNGQVADFCKP